MPSAALSKTSDGMGVRAALDGVLVTGVGIGFPAGAGGGGGCFSVDQRSDTKSPMALSKGSELGTGGGASKLGLSGDQAARVGAGAGATDGGGGGRANIRGGALNELLVGTIAPGS